MNGLLRLDNLVAGYGSLTVLKGLSLSVAKGEIVGLVGANGAGKSTLLNAISGVIPMRSGSILFDGENLGGRRAAAIARAGLRHVPEGRRVFAELSVEDNLRLGAYGTRNDEIEKEIAGNLRDVSASRRAPSPGGGHYVGRRAADARNRSRVDGQTSSSDAG